MNVSTQKERNEHEINKGTEFVEYQLRQNVKYIFTGNRETKEYKKAIKIKKTYTMLCIYSD